MGSKIETERETARVACANGDGGCPKPEIRIWRNASIGFHDSRRKNESAGYSFNT